MNTPKMREAVDRFLRCHLAYDSDQLDTVAAWRRAGDAMVRARRQLQRKSEKAPAPSGGDVAAQAGWDYRVDLLEVHRGIDLSLRGIDVSLSRLVDILATRLPAAVGAPASEPRSGGSEGVGEEDSGSGGVEEMEWEEAEAESESAGEDGAEEDGEGEGTDS